MAHIRFLDETMRDGQQSLWGMRMQAGMALPVAPIIDRTGYTTISLAGSSLFEVLDPPVPRGPVGRPRPARRRDAQYAARGRHPLRTAR